MIHLESCRCLSVELVFSDWWWFHRDMQWFYVTFGWSRWKFWGGYLGCTDSWVVSNVSHLFLSWIFYGQSSRDLASDLLVIVFSCREIRDGFLVWHVFHVSAISLHRRDARLVDATPFSSLYHGCSLRDAGTWSDFLKDIAPHFVGYWINEILVDWLINCHHIVSYAWSWVISVVFQFVEQEKRFTTRDIHLKVALGNLQKVKMGDDAPMPERERNKATESSCGRSSKDSTSTSASRPGINGARVYSSSLVDLW